MPTDPDAPGNEPNLELPSFGFGRRKKRGKKPAEERHDVVSTAGGQETEETAPEPPAAEAAAEPTAPVAPPAPARAPDAPATPATGPTPARPPARAPARPAARPPSRPPSGAAPPAGPAPARPATTPASSDDPRTTTPDQPPLAPPPLAPPTVDEEESGTVVEPAAVDPLDGASAALDEPASLPAGRREDRGGTRARRRAEKNAGKRARREADRAAKAERAGGPAGAPVAHLPAIHPLLAAILSGALSGLATVLLAFGAARGCDAVRGTDSCGGGLGLLALVAILALEVLIGANLLKAWRIADPYSTSFLGVGVVATIAMIAFLDQINSPWMFLVIPLMTAASFTLSWWITVRFIDEHPMTSEADSELGEPAVPERAATGRSRDETEDEDSNA